MVEFNIDRNLRHGESVTVEELAEKESLHPDDVDLVVRHASSRHYLKQDSKGRVSHSSLSKAILTVPMLHEFISWILGHMCM